MLRDSSCRRDATPASGARCRDARRGAELHTRISSSVELRASSRRLGVELFREVEIIGEAAARISRELAESTRQIPWGKVAGMGNRLIHAYFDIDFDILWETVVSAIPALADEVERLLDSE